MNRFHETEKNDVLVLVAFIGSASREGDVPCENISVQTDEVSWNLFMPRLAGMPCNMQGKVTE